MAHDFHTQVLVDNTRKTIIKYTAICDGSSGELSAAILYDASAYVSPTTYTGIEYIEATLIGCSAMLYWDATTDVPIMGLPPDHPHRVDLTDDRLYNLPNDGAAANRTGDILISTNGFTASGDSITIIISVIKKSA